LPMQGFLEIRLAVVAWSAYGAILCGHGAIIY
jgi:hypothetical protein